MNSIILMGTHGISPEESARLQAQHTEMVRNLDFNNPHCPKCGNKAFFGRICKEKHWTFYECDCGTELYPEERGKK
jgi:hypothetical protein